MKLLLDQNLSYRLIQPLSAVYPGSTQVGLLDMGNATDKAIWDYAKANDYIIVTLDADFHEYSLLWSGPPLIVWLKCGNQPKQVILDKLLSYQLNIEESLQDKDIWCVELY